MLCFYFDQKLRKNLVRRSKEADEDKDKSEYLCQVFLNISCLHLNVKGSQAESTHTKFSANDNIFFAPSRLKLNLSEKF